MGRGRSCLNYPGRPSSLTTGIGERLFLTAQPHFPKASLGFCEQVAVQDLGADGDLRGGLDHCWPVPPVKKPLLNFGPLPSYDPRLLPHTTTSQDFSLLGEAFSPSFLSAPPLHLMEFSLHTLGPRSILTCHLLSWWTELDHPDSMRSLDWFRTGWPLAVGRKNPSMVWRVPTKWPLSRQQALSLVSHVLCSFLGSSSALSQRSTFEWMITWKSKHARCLVRMCWTSL